MRVSRQDHPELFKILRKAGYRKHSATVYVRATATCTQPYWSGGSRTDNIGLSLPSGFTHPINTPRNPFPEPPASTEIETAPGFAVVHGGTFMGKAAHWTIYMHVADAQKFIGAEVN